MKFMNRQNPWDLEKAVSGTRGRDWKWALTYLLNVVLDIMRVYTNGNAL